MGEGDRGPRVVFGERGRCVPLQSIVYCVCMLALARKFKQNQHEGSRNTIQRPTTATQSWSKDHRRYTNDLPGVMRPWASQSTCGAHTRDVFSFDCCWLCCMIPLLPHGWIGSGCVRRTSAGYGASKTWRGCRVRCATRCSVPAGSVCVACVDRYVWVFFGWHRCL